MNYRFTFFSFLFFSQFLILSPVLSQTGAVCVPGTVSGCKICNSSGSDWISDNLKCALGQTCKDGVCFFACQNECVAAGAKMCFGGGYQVCVKNDQTGCLKWSGVFGCSAGQSCFGGECAKNQTVSGADLTLSDLSPSGLLNVPETVLFLRTNIAANCRYDTLDKGFDSMKGIFSTSDYLRHQASFTLQKKGDYVYYVRCRDGDGGIENGKISFVYGEKINFESEKEAVQKLSAPIISRLSPLGKVSAQKVEIGCATDKPAVCNYDVFDTDYDSMENSLAVSADGLEHRRDLGAMESGKYAYYIRCRDKDNNENKNSAKIEFEYEKISPAAIAISNAEPSGNVYQKDVVIAAETDRPADCRCAPEDIGFDLMENRLDSDDGLRHQAAVVLDGFGDYDYRLVCRNRTEFENFGSSTVSFSYIDPGFGEETESGVENDVENSGVSNCSDGVDCGGSRSAEKNAAESNGWIFAACGVSAFLATVAAIVFLSRRKNANNENFSE